MLSGYGVFRAYYLYMKFDANISTISLIRSMNDGQIYKPQELGFDFAFGVSSELDPSIGYFTVKQIGYYETDQFELNGKKVMNKTERNLRLDKCQDKHFNFTDQKEVALKGISKYLCAIDDDYQLQGFFYQQNFEFVEIKLWKCQNSSKQAVICQDSKKIDEYFEKETFNFAFINTYFDFQEYDSGKIIKKYIDDSFLFELEAQKIKKLNFYIQLQEAETQDSYIQFGQYESYKFHQISNERTYDDGYSDSEGYIAVVYMRFDMKYDLYNRKIYSLLEYLGDMGGLYRSMISIGFVIVGQIIKRMFFSDIMHKIYQIRTTSIEIDDDHQRGKKQSPISHNEGKLHNNQNAIKHDDIEAVPSGPFQQTFSNLFKQNILETSSESSDSDNNDMDTLSLMEHKNPMIRLVTYGKLKKMMQSFEGKKLQTLESNLIRGVFKRKLKDWEEKIKKENSKMTLLQRLQSTSPMDAQLKQKDQKRDNKDKKAQKQINLDIIQTQVTSENENMTLKKLVKKRRARVNL
ncbi:UNKNOWN [Stylonychia lemnae]|uniref:Uncharacterized protein n=1 Tax=Stylonychia lemnae TaxID=5949 RepID=A0A078ANB9_STYLE|nr:UNKNOWN [Stylonychia lemnae]|eukprot:CDW82837.1 UNKNOWN [Stylonychia lemnae]